MAAGCLCEGNVLEIQALPASGGPQTSTSAPAHSATLAAPMTSLAEPLDAISRAHILRVLRATGWIVAGPAGAAARLGMKRSTLNFRMKKLGIVRPLLGEVTDVP